jgi:hypothetical protein
MRRGNKVRLCGLQVDHYMASFAEFGERLWGLPASSLPRLRPYDSSRVRLDSDV